MDRNLALEFVRVTEAAAIAAAKWVGKGEGKKADGAAVDEMRDRFNQIDFKGTVVIGEGSKDEAPELYNGEKVGRGWGKTADKSANYNFDLAIDPLECTDSVAFGRYNAMSVIAAGAKGSLMNAPDTYMEKIAVGPAAAKVIDLDAPVKTNLSKVAKVLGKKVGDVTVCILDRERHFNLISQVRRAGARVRLITDGDVAGAVAACLPESGIDVLMGIGGSTESVLAAVPIKIFGGQIFCRFKPKDKHHLNLVKRHGLNTKKIYSAEDLAKGSVLTFTATGVIDGPLLRGVRFADPVIVTHSMVVRGQSGTVRYIVAHHQNIN
ncbi:MAG: class II fructose-bisphosphatase [Patescibacteria group bacterium]|nr:class II fructose-bisphosphatase [Patescibacteria group bacterium]